MTSWLLRTAVAHGCPWNRMIELLRRAGIGDPDFMWPWDVQSSAAYFAVDPEALASMIAWSESFVAQERAYDLMRGQARAPAFGLCSECIRETRVAHYRVESRFEFSTLCAQHGVVLHITGYGSLQALQNEPMACFALGKTLEADGVVGCVHRLALERRIARLVRCGYERNPTLGILPARAVLAAESWRLRPKAAGRSTFAA